MLKKCYICGEGFEPDKWHPYQKLCSRLVCKKEWKKQYGSKWRKQNPGYFSGGWRDNKEACRKWRRENPDYYKEYRKNHPELKKRNAEYVRKHREEKQSVSK